jgi:hypothetical protein
LRAETPDLSIALDEGATWITRVAKQQILFKRIAPVFEISSHVAYAIGEMLEVGFALLGERAIELFEVVTSCRGTCCKYPDEL